MIVISNLRTAGFQPALQVIVLYAGKMPAVQQNF